MGAGASSALGPEVEVGAHEVGLGDLPESCVAEVMLRLSPAEICRLARLSRAFRGAAATDFVWATKLPENYKYLMDKASAESESESDSKGVLTKKEIYAQLCRRNPFDGGTKVRNFVIFGGNLGFCC